MSLYISNGEYERIFELSPVGVGTTTLRFVQDKLVKKEEAKGIQETVPVSTKSMHARKKKKTRLEIL
jgi:hypothetical protein